MLSSDRKKQLRAISHNLKPIVTIAGNGLTEAVLAELERALNDHELIKVKLAVGEREERSELIEALCEKTGAEKVQAIGKVIVLFRAAKKPNAKLSNLLRM
ncbi:ribosome assembly RNA-binding protein YhbY [Aurantivibrio infirmus]